MDKINAQNLVKLLKSRCETINISNETEYPTTKGLLMHAALLIEDEIIAPKNTVGFFLDHTPLSYGAGITITRKSDVIVKEGPFGKIYEKLSIDILKLEIKEIRVIHFSPGKRSDLLPVLEIEVI